MGNAREPGSERASITVTHGEVVCTPIPYHTFRVGPFSITIELDEDSLVPDSIKRTIERARAVLHEQARKEYAEAKKFWFDEWKVGGRS